MPTLVLQYLDEEGDLVAVRFITLFSRSSRLIIFFRSPRRLSSLRHSFPLNQAALFIALLGLLLKLSTRIPLTGRKNLLVAAVGTENDLDLHSNLARDRFIEKYDRMEVLVVCMVVMEGLVATPSSLEMLGMAGMGVNMEDMEVNMEGMEAYIEDMGVDMSHLSVSDTPPSEIEANRDLPLLFDDVGPRIDQEAGPQLALIAIAPSLAAVPAPSLTAVPAPAVPVVAFLLNLNPCGNFLMGLYRVDSLPFLLPLPHLMKQG